MASTPEVDFDGNVTDPDQMEAQVEQSNQNAVLNSRNPITMGMAVAAQGAELAGKNLAQFTGNMDVGNPQVVQSRKIAAAMQAISASVDDNLPEDATPIERSQAIAQQVARKMWSVNPAMAMQANTQAVALQQAQTQQALLTQRTRAETATADLDNTKSEEAKAGALYQVHSIEKGADGLPMYKAYGAPISLYGTDGAVDPNFHSNLKSALDDATKQGATNPVYTTVDKFASAKDNIAMIRQQGAVQMQLAKVNQQAQTLAAPPTDEEQILAKKVSEGDAPFPSLSSRNPMTARIAAQALQMNPSLTAETYPTRQAAYKAFGTGKQGDTVRSFNVAYAHMDTVEQATAALNNGDLRGFNSLTNLMRKETGQPEATNLDTALQMVKGELVKAVVGSQAALEDRTRALGQISADSGPDAIKGSLSTVRQLILGQVRGLQRQYENTTNKYDFATMLSPSVASALGTQHPAAALNAASPKPVRIYNPSTGKFD